MSVKRGQIVPGKLQRGEFVCMKRQFSLFNLGLSQQKSKPYFGQSLLK